MPWLCPLEMEDSLEALAPCWDLTPGINAVNNQKGLSILVLNLCSCGGGRREKGRNTDGQEQ